MLMASMNLQVVTDTVIVPEPNSLLETNSLTHTPWMRQVIFAHHQVCQALVCIDRDLSVTSSIRCCLWKSHIREDLSTGTH
jgi:hypothetical protein